jgi:hypothetical protein
VLVDLGQRHFNCFMERQVLLFGTFGSPFSMEFFECGDGEVKCGP